jgi:long-chain acyl-CoA synthetase
MFTFPISHLHTLLNQGDVLKLTQDLAVLKPTVMVSVPRLYNRFYDLMQAKIRELTGMKKMLTEWGI